jgi:hypothetical protein
VRGMSQTPIQQWLCLPTMARTIQFHSLCFPSCVVETSRCIAKHADSYVPALARPRPTHPPPIVEVKTHSKLPSDALVMMLAALDTDVMLWFGCLQRVACQGISDGRWPRFTSCSSCQCMSRHVAGLLIVCIDLLQSQSALNLVLM